MTAPIFKFSVITLSLSLSACMSQQIANTKHLDDAVNKQAASVTLTPQQVCENASQAVAKGNHEALHFFAPLHLDQAADALEDGQKQIKSKETEAEGVKLCLKVNQLIENGIVIKDKVKNALSDSLTQLEMLKKVDAEKKFTDDIQDASDDIVDLAKDIEAGKMNEAMKGQASLISDMLELEIEIVTDKNLTPVEAMLEKAEDADADDLAEKTFEKAEQALESARKYILTNYRNNEQVEANSAQAMLAAKHAYHVAKEVATLKELKAEAAEEKVLYIESLFERINIQFNSDVVIGNSLYDQSSIIKDQLEELINSKTALARELTEIKNKPVVTPLSEKTEIQPEALQESEAAPVESAESVIEEKTEKNETSEQAGVSAVSDLPDNG